MATDHFQLSPADVEARFQRLQMPAPAASRCRRSAVPADRRRRLPDQRRERQRLQQPSPERSRQDHLHAAAEHQAHRSGDRTPRRHETFVDVWRSVPSVNNVAAHGAGRCQSVAARSERVRRLSAGRAGDDAPGAGARRADATTPQIQGAPPQQLLDDLSAFQRVLFTNHRVRALADAIRTRREPAAGCGSPAHRARTAGQGRVRARLHAVPRRSGTVDAAGAGDPLSRHLHAVSAARRHVTPRPLRATRRARRDSRAMRGPMRSRWRTARRSAARAPIPAARC